LKTREISAFSGDMFTTERWTTQHAELSSARREHILSSSVCEVPVETKC